MIIDCHNHVGLDDRLYRSGAHPYAQDLPTMTGIGGENIGTGLSPDGRESRSGLKEEGMHLHWLAANTGRLGMDDALLENLDGVREEAREAMKATP